MDQLQKLMIPFTTELPKIDAFIQKLDPKIQNSLRDQNNFINFRY